MIADFPGIIAKARTKLEKLEKRAFHDQHQETACTQLDLFDSYDNHPALDMLNEIDTDSTSPKEALDILYKLKALLD